MGLLVILSLVCVVVGILFLVFKSTETIYVDEGKSSRAFINKKYNIIAKPDLINKLVFSRVEIREYKSRKRNIYHSDVVQAIASSLAVSDEYKVSRIIVENGSGEIKRIPFSSKRKMFSKIAKEYGIAKKIIDGDFSDIKASASKTKCRSCPYKNDCSKAIK